MKTRWILAVGLTAALAFVWVGPAAAQMSQRVINIRKITPDKKASTPRYEMKPSIPMQRTLNWTSITVTYDVDPPGNNEWLDELTFTYYVLVRKKAGEQPKLLKGDVTYINIAKGRGLLADIFLHPSTVARFGNVDRVAVLVSYRGQILAGESLPASSQRWWEQLPPTEGLLLNRQQTPFAMVNFDDYEAIKPAAR